MKLLRIAGITAAVLMLAAGLMVLRLTAGPMSIAFLTPLIDSSLKEAFPGLTISYEDPSLAWSPDRNTVDLRVANASLRAADGSLDMRLPEIAIAFADAPLLHLEFAAKRVDLIGAKMTLRWSASEFDSKVQRLIRGEDGGPQPPEAAPASETLLVDSHVETKAEDLVKRLLASPDGEGALGTLEEVRIRDADFELLEEDGNRRWQMPGAEIAFRRGLDGMTLEVATDLIAAGERAEFRLESVNDAAGEGVVKFVISGLNPAHLARDVGLTGLFLALDMPLSGTVEIAHQGGDKLRSINFDLHAGQGLLNLPEVYPAPPALQSLQLRGNYDGLSHVLTIGSFRADLDGPVLAGDAVVDFADDFSTPGVRFSTALGPMSMRRILLYWPPDAGRGGHDWIDRNMPEIEIDKAQFTVDIRPEDWGQRPLPEHVFNIGFEFSNATAHYLRPMPPITGASGSGSVSPAALDIRITTGEVGGMLLAPSRFQISDLSLRGRQMGHATIEMISTVPELLAFIDLKPLNLTAKFGIAPDAILGNAVTFTRLDFPLRRGTTLADVAVNVSAVTQNVTVPGLFSDGDLTDGALRLKVDREGLEAEGPVRLKGVLFDLTWSEQFGLRESDALSSRFELSAAMSGADLVKFGVPALPHVTGRVQTHLVLLGKNLRLVSGQGTIDFRDAGVSAAKLIWDKKPGSPGRASFDLAWQEDRFLIPGFVLQSGAVAIEGSFAFDRASGEMIEARIPTLMTAGHDMALNIDRVRPGLLHFDIQADRLDARPWLLGLTRPGSGPAPAMAFTIEATEVQALNGVVIRDLVASGENSGDYWEQATLTGVMPEGGTIALTLIAARDKRDLTLISDDAGRVALGAGLFMNGSGGGMVLSAELNQREDKDYVAGELVIENFRVVKSAALVEALVAREGREVDDLLDDNGLTFGRFSLPFTFSDGIADISGARASGPALGFTIEGQADLYMQEVQLNGIIVPAFALNSLLSNIPIVGSILTGGEGEGLFALTYRIEGPSDDPVVTINPMTALAPGFLRKIFEGPKGAIDLERRQERLETGGNGEGQNGDARPARPPRERPYPNY